MDAIITILYKAKFKSDSINEKKDIVDYILTNATMFHDVDPYNYRDSTYDFKILLLVYKLIPNKIYIPPGINCSYDPYEYLNDLLKATNPNFY